MTLEICFLVIQALWLGFQIGRAWKKQRDVSDLIWLSNKLYAQGYSDAIREFDIQQKLPRQLELVGGRDVEGKCS